MSKSILMHENGGPEKMQLEDVEVGSPGPGQVKIRHTAIGLNFIDVYTRSGLYQTPMPNAVGREAAGVIVEVGPKVKGFKKGDRVAYCGVLGAYCQERVMGVEQLVHVPKGVSDEQAAAIMLKGMTTEYLLDHCAKPWLKKGDIVLFHAAAGGVGLLFGQWAKARGYKVIGTVSSPEKAALAKKNGYKWVIDYTKEDVVDEVKEITKGKGVPVVFDGVGKDTWDGLARLPAAARPDGLVRQRLGCRSRRQPPGILNTKGSLYLTRPSLGAYTATRKDLEASRQVAVQDGQERQGQDRHRPALSAGARRRRPISTSKAARPPARPSWCPDGARRSAFDDDRRPDRLHRHGQIDRSEDAAADGRAGVRRRCRRPCPAGAGRRGAAADRGGVSRRGEGRRARSPGAGRPRVRQQGGAAQARSHRPSAGRPAASAPS